MSADPVMAGNADYAESERATAELSTKDVAYIYATLAVAFEIRRATEKIVKALDRLPVGA